ncbi:MAG: TonB-dependent receptor [Bacteroidota bacterium]
MRILRKLSIGLIAGAALAHPMRAQDTGADTAQNRTYAFTIQEDVLNLEVRSIELPKVNSLGILPTEQADVPYSVTVLTANRLAKLGVRTIPEALRFVPGVLVREVTRDNYTVHFRGATRYTQVRELYQAEAPTVLLLIDGNPWNNAFDGSITWNQLPVSMDDIDRIEVYRSPMGVVQGLEAVEGVVHIITKEASRNGIHASAVSEFTNSRQYRHSAAVEVGIKSRLTIRVGAQYFSSARTMDMAYFHLPTDSWIPLDSLLYVQADASSVASFPSLARTGFSGYTQLRYVGKKEGKFALGVHLGSGQEQTVFRQMGDISLTNRNLQNTSVNLEGEYKGLYTKNQLVFVIADMGVGYPGAVASGPRLYTETGYNRQFGALKIHGGIMGYAGVTASITEEQLAEIDSDDSTALNSFLVNNIGSLFVGDMFVQGQYGLLDNTLLFHAGYRQPIVDSAESIRSPSYLLGATYRLPSQQTVRVAFSSATGISHGWENFYSNTERATPGHTRHFNPLPSLDPIRSQSIEVGFRGSVLENGYLDVELFRTSIQDVPIAVFQGTADVARDTIIWTHASRAPVKQGASIGAEWFTNNFSVGGNFNMLFNRVPSEDLGLEPFVMFGSLFGTYTTPLERLTASMNMNLYGPETLYGYDGRSQQLPFRSMLNAYVNFQLNPNALVYVNANNILNDESIQALYGDPGRRLWSFGVKVNL